MKQEQRPGDTIQRMVGVPFGKCEEEVGLFHQAMQENTYMIEHDGTERLVEEHLFAVSPIYPSFTISRNRIELRGEL